MKLGFIFPQTEIGTDPGAIRDLAQTVEGLGYAYLMPFEHVLGADTRHHQGWRGSYALHDAFHEPMVLFGYLASVTSRIRLLTGVLVLPQRQTVLVAKQAAEVDVLSGGRLDLGIGVGWNRVEYQALGMEFTNRGKRSEEQVQVLRLLWTQESVEFAGRWHRIDHAGLNPLPVQRPIPIWFGGTAEALLERAGRLGDGWLPMGAPDAQRAAAVERLRGYAARAGRDPSSLAVGASVALARGGKETVLAEARAWARLGATHLSLNTMRAGLGSVRDHLAAATWFSEAMRQEGLAD